MKASAEAQVTDAEKILIRALASATEMQTLEEHSSSRDGVDEEFDPARQAQFALNSERLHVGLATESLIEVLLHAPDTGDILELPLSEADRNLLAAVLLRDAEELTAERLDGAVRAVRRIHLRRKLEEIQRELQGKRSQEPGRLQALLEEKIRLKRALMDPGEPDARISA